jgi:hypothetical protein
MKLPYIIALIGVMCAGCRDSTPPSSSVADSSEPAQIRQELQRIVPTVSAPASENETLALLPAHFSDNNAGIGGPIGRGLSGEDLYLFPDHLYCYLRWADILPPTIFDRGTWLFANGVVSLQSDHSVPQRDFPKDSRFVPLYYKISGKRTLLLMGTSWDFAYFKEKAKTNDDYMLFLCTLTRIESIEPARAETLRKKMYAENWRPEFFKK